MAHATRSGALWIVAGHRRRPNAKNALVRATAAGPKLKVRKFLPLRVAIEVTPIHSRLEPRMRRGVHLFRCKKIVTNKPGLAVDHSERSLFVLALDARMHRQLCENLFWIAGRDGTAEHNLRVGLGVV